MEEEEDQVASYMGSVLREGGDRCLNLVYGAGGGLVAAQDGGKCVDVFRVRGEAEARKKMKRRIKVDAYGDWIGAGVGIGVVGCMYVCVYVCVSVQYVDRTLQIEYPTKR